MQQVQRVDKYTGHVQQAQRVNRVLNLRETSSESGKGEGLVCNRFREWISMLDLCTTGSESG